jgi:hypothetical protein
MSVAAAARPGSMRDIRWPVWVLVALAALVVVYGLTQSGLQIGSFTFAAPLLFAAAVVYVAPADRRFTWAAVLIALMPVVLIITGWLPDFWFDTVPGDWKNATPLLMDLGDLAVQIARVLGFVGLALLGLALGSVRTLASAAIIGIGLLFAVFQMVGFLGSPIEGMPIDLTVRSLVFPTLYIVGWAFVFAAALESRRTLMTVGTGLTFALIAFDRLQDWWLALPRGPLDALLLLTGALGLLGWALIILAPLRGELNGAPSRSAGDL